MVGYSFLRLAVQSGELQFPLSCGIEWKWSMAHSALYEMIMR